MSLKAVFEKRALVLSALLLIGGLRFLHLDFGEIQEWDEALYAVRAKSIVHFGDWLDQTNHAVGGLYSAAHPPLYIWLTAATYKVFGITNFTTRVWSAIFACGLILFLYLFGKRLYNETTGFFGAALLGTTPLFLFYSRQGQLDIAYLFFLVISLYFLLIYIENRRLFILFASAFSFGLCLAVKSLAGLLAVPIAFLLLYTKSRLGTGADRQVWFPFLVYTALGVAVVLPWYVYMELQHSDPSSMGSFLGHVIGSVPALARGLGTNIKELGFLYFLNQLIVRFPLGILGFMYIGVTVYRFLKKNEMQVVELRTWFVPLWFLIVFFFFSTLQTKVVTYTLPMLVPLSILTAYAGSKLASGEAEKSTSILFTLALGISLLWSISDEIRVEVKEFLRASESPTLINGLSTPLLQFLLLATIIFAIVAVSWRSESVRRTIGKAFIPVAIIVSVALSLFQLLFIQEEHYVDGARDLASRIKPANYAGILFIHTPHYTGGMNPQLAFYLDGLNAGWVEEKFFLEVSRGEIDSVKQMSEVYAPQDIFIIIEKNHYDRPEKSEELKKVEETVTHRYQKLLETRRYILYGNS